MVADSALDNEKTYLDFFDEKIMRMDNQVLKNLDQLEDSSILLERSSMKESNRSNSNSSSQRSTSFKNLDDLFKDELDVEGELNLSRNVVIKQYAPKTFKAIRELDDI